MEAFGRRPRGQADREVRAGRDRGTGPALEGEQGIVDDVIAEVGATSIRDLGRVMADVMPRVSGRADGSVVSQLVRSWPGDVVRWARAQRRSPEPDSSAGGPYDRERYRRCSGSRPRWRPGPAARPRRAPRELRRGERLSRRRSTCAGSSWMRAVAARPRAGERRIGAYRAAGRTSARRRRMRSRSRRRPVSRSSRAPAQVFDRDFRGRLRWPARLQALSPLRVAGRGAGGDRVETEEAQCFQLEALPPLREDTEQLVRSSPWRATARGVRLVGGRAKDRARRPRMRERTRR
jgi:hypothetical protein